MWTIHAPLASLRHRVLRRPRADIAALAARSWEVAPAESAIAPPALFLPNQIERVTGWAFSDGNPAHKMGGGHVARHEATRAHLIHDVWLLDGTLFHRDRARCIAKPTSRVPRLFARHEIAEATIFSTFGGNQYFGQWLLDDCLTYALAAAEGLPLAPPAPPWGHLPDYERRLGMAPERTVAARVNRMVVFDDVGQNRDKSRRFRDARSKLLSAVAAAPHAGVFLVRGRTGQRRLLRNELEIAARLRDRRGFTILDPSATDLSTILAACAGARIVAGVEGSHLIHGLMTMEVGAGLLTIQPPDRFVGVLKDVTDREEQHFGFVVGRPAGADFIADPDEVERTLDLFPR